MITKRKRGLLALLAAITLLSSNAIMASAYEYSPAPTSITVQAAVPNNTPQEYKNATGQQGGGNKGNTESIDAREILGEGAIGKDDTGYAEEINGYGQLIAKFVINTAVYIFATMLLIVFAIDCLCIPFPPIARFFATKVPIQLFSNEVAGITGIQYSHGSNSGGGAPPPAPSNGGANGQQGVGAKYITYFKDRAIALIFSGALLVMTYSGLLSRLLNTVINAIVGLFNK